MVEKCYRERRFRQVSSRGEKHRCERDERRRQRERERGKREGRTFKTTCFASIDFAKAPATSGVECPRAADFSLTEANVAAPSFFEAEGM